MTTTETPISEGVHTLLPTVEADLQQKAKDHLWMHFTRQSVMEDGHGVPIIVKGEGHHIWDSRGRKYIDGLSGLFVVNAGHGRKRLAEVAAKQAEELAFFPLWSYAHPAAIELADRIADYAPGDLNRVFFSTGGGEAVETAFKLAKYYWKLQGRGTKHKVISRSVAYHGTPQGALAITGIPAMKEMFEPVTPGGFRVPRLSHLCKTRAVSAGSIVGAGPVSHADWRQGYSCIAEKRAVETVETGQPTTRFMQFGDTLRIEVKGKNGQSLFGAIEQEITPPA